MNEFLEKLITRIKEYNPNADLTKLLKAYT